MPTVFDNIETPFLDGEDSNGIKHALENKLPLVIGQQDSILLYTRFKDEIKGYQLPIPRLTATYPDFSSRWPNAQPASMTSRPRNSSTFSAHSQHILSTFPLVDESVKSQTLNTYRELLKSGKFT